MEFENLEAFEEFVNIEEVKPRPIGVYVKRDKNGKIINVTRNNTPIRSIFS